MTKLFIPGPVHVLPEVLEKLSTYPLGHRSKAWSEFQGALVPKLRKILLTEGGVFLFTSSGSGGWEAAIRNCVPEGGKVLSCMCGAFSDKWASVAEACGRKVTKLQVEWGNPVTAGQVAGALAKDKFDAVTYVHNETSTGVANPLAEVAGVVKKHPDTFLLVDAVSSMTGMELRVDDWGIDVCLAGVQKAFALPPGLAVVTASARALERAKGIGGRGYYFDLLQYAKAAAKDQTPTTPAEPHLFALDLACDRILAEGVEARWARHREMAGLVRAWAADRFELFAPEGYRSETLTCVKNSRGISIDELNKKLMAKHDCMISNGYGALKEKTFRISHMGDLQKADLEELLGWIDGLL